MTLPLIYLNEKQSLTREDAIDLSVKSAKGFGNSALKAIQKLPNLEIRDSFNNLLQVGIWDRAS